MRAWKQTRIANAPLEIIDGDRGKNYPKQNEFADDGYCLFLNTGNVTTSGFMFKSCQFVSEDKDRVLRNGRLQLKDIVMTTRGTVGNVAYFNEAVPFETIRINSSMVIFRTNENSLLPSFLYQYLRSLLFQREVRAIRSGAAQPQLPIRDINTIKIPLPPISVQTRIATILSAYDDLIENNRRRIELLQDTAQQLYKEWFVRFRFPGHEHVPLVNGVPEEWELKRLINLAEITMGQSPKSEFYNEDGDGHPFHQGVTNFGFRYVNHQRYCTKATRMAQSGDILFSVRAPVGRMNLTNDRIVLGRGLSAMHSRTGHQSFLFYQLKSFFFKEDLVGSGAIYAAVNKKQLENQELLCPPLQLIDQFEEIVSSIDQQIKVLVQSIDKLANARDILLPKLITGEIEV